MTPQEIATRLDDQFRLLRGGTRGAVERHQTLRRAMDWSYDLLSDDERLVLRTALGLRRWRHPGRCRGGRRGRHRRRARRARAPQRDWSGGRSCSPTTTKAALAIACSKPFASTPTSTSSKQGRRTHCSVATPCTTPRSPSKQAQVSAAPTNSPGSHASPPRSATCVPRRRWAIDHDELDLALDVIVPLCVSGTTIGYTAIRVGERTRDRTRRRHTPARPRAARPGRVPRRGRLARPRPRDRVRGPPNCSRSSAGSAAQPRQLSGTDRHRPALRNPHRRGRLRTPLGRSRTRRRRPLRNGRGAHHPRGNHGRDRHRRRGLGHARVRRRGA